ncbi:MAG: DUF3592 domain-containing protein [Clostridia bacterium]|nr:DUF3592 domain-containing protein [Clostridia bacterium]MDE6210545.1 DUF3592 domain-containing protein [Clostridia bacterium]
MKVFSASYVSSGSGKKAWIAYLFIFVVAFAFIGGGIWNLLAKQAKIDGYVKTQATVVDYKVNVDRDYNDLGYYTETKTYAEKVTYVVNGKEYRATNDVSSSSPKSIGSKIEIAYNPEDPSQCIFVKSTYITTILLFAIGGIASVIGVIMVFLDIKQRCSAH